MKLQDKHKQFTVKYDVQSLVPDVSISFLCKKLYTPISNSILDCNSDTCYCAFI